MTSFNPTSKKYWTNNRIVLWQPTLKCKNLNETTYFNRSKIYRRKFTPVQHLCETFSLDITLVAPLYFQTIFDSLRPSNSAGLGKRILDYHFYLLSERFSLAAIETILCTSTCWLSSMTLWDLKNTSSQVLANFFMRENMANIMKEDKIVVFFN